MIAHVNIGSNIGDRQALIDLAVTRIEASLGVKARRAPLEESEPWGYESPNPFLNLGIAIETDLDPLALHRLLQQIQFSISPDPHRTPDGGYADRPIDIDLIAVGDRVVATPELTLPHPRMHLRPFVLRPIAHLEPAWRHPLLHLSALQLLAVLPEN